MSKDGERIICPKGEQYTHGKKLSQRWKGSASRKDAEGLANG